MLTMNKIRAVLKAHGVIFEERNGDEIKESRTINRTNLNHEPKTSSKWYDYLTDEERKTLETIKENATRRMNDPLEILLRQKRELEKKISELQSKDTK